MTYIIQRQSKYYYNRRPPSALRDFEPRKLIRFSLNTDSRHLAAKLAIIQNERLEAYWKGLLETGEKHSDKEYKALVDRAKLLGFSYCFNPVLATRPVEDIISRLEHIHKNKYNEKHVEAVLGGRAPPEIKLDDALTRFWDMAKDKVLNKSANQIRKWKTPRIKAMRNFISCVGNKPIHELTRDDTLRFRDWWIDRLDTESMASGSANKDLIYVKVIITTIVENLKIEIDTAHLFKKLILTKVDQEKRLPLESAYIRDTLLNPNNLKGLNHQAKCALMAFSETGAGLSELIGLQAEDICLDDEIPYISIKPRKKKELKTKFRERKIPLVGYALDAFKSYPDGFTKYKDRPDTLSAVLVKYLRENNLLPSRQHSVYSLRHSFQDRILSVNCPDRIQADLMGHKFNRPYYGDGATLAHKLEWLKKIQLKPETAR